ncbi:hypothetical protein ACWEP4_44515 [Streptomyces sp. NPDC004227]
MTKTNDHAGDTVSLVYQCRLPLSTHTVNHLADLLRRHLKAIRSRWRVLPPGKIAVIVLAVLRHDQRLRCSTTRITAVVRAVVTLELAI